MLKKSISHFSSSILVLVALSATACTLNQTTAIPTSTAGSVPTVSIGNTAIPAATSTPENPATPAATDTPSATLTPTPTATPQTPMVQAKSISTYCRFGPGTDYLSIGMLNPGVQVPVQATVEDNSWWEIQNPSNSSTYCWVGNAVTTFSGDLSQVPIVAAPNGNAIRVTVSLTSVIHGACSGSNTNTFQGTITTNGPSIIGYNWEVDNSAGAQMTTITEPSLVFQTASTQSVVAGSYTGGCGNYVVRLIVTYPNILEGRATYEAEP